MKKLTLLLTLFSFSAQAGLPPTMSKGQSDANPTVTFNFQAPNSTVTRTGGTTALIETGNENYLLNPSFEGTTFSTSWTAAIITPVVETTIIKAGKNSAKLTYSAQTGGYSQDVTPTQQFASTNLEASCWVNTSLTTMQVCARTAGADLSNCTAVPSTGTWQYVPMNFSAANGASIGVNVKTSSSTTGSAYVDNCYVGPARNLSQVNQVQELGTITWPATASCFWSTTSTSFSAFSATSACVLPTGGNVTGQATAPATKIPAITFPSIAQGVLDIQVNGALYVTTGASNTISQYQISDGTNVSDAGVIQPISSSGLSGAASQGFGSYTFRIPYPNGASNVTLQIQAKSGNAANTTFVDTQTAPLTIKVKLFPTQNQTAVNSNSVGPSQQSHTAVTGYGSTNTVVLRYTNNTVAIGSDITYTPSSTNGDSWTINSSGNYCATGTLRESAGGNEWRLGRNVAGTINTDPAGVGLSSTGNNGWIATAGTVAATPAGGLAWCGYLAQGDVLVTAIKAGLTFSTMGFSIAKVNNTNNSPLLVGSVTSSSKGMELFERVYVGGVKCTSSPCTMTANTPGISSVTWSGTGQYVVHFTAGAFSAPPTCVTSGLLLGAGNGWCQSESSATTSVQTLACALSSTGALQDDGFSVLCTGPR